METGIQPFSARQRMLNNHYEIYRYEDARLQEVALHHHDFYEVYFFLSGSVSYNIESRTHRLQPGDMLLISPLELHQPVITEESQPYKRIVLWVSKSLLEQASSAQSDLARCFDVRGDGHVNLLRFDPVKRQWIRGLLDSILYENYSGEYGGDAAAYALLLQLLVEVNRQAANRPRTPQTLDRSETLISEVLQYIHVHFAQVLSLDALAAHFFLSKYHLSHEFRRLVGTSVYRYIIQKRLLMSKQMLLAGQSPTSVSANCGFGDYTNFYRAFKSEYGMSPGQFVADMKQIF